MLKSAFKAEQVNLSINQLNQTVEKSRSFFFYLRARVPIRVFWPISLGIPPRISFLPEEDKEGTQEVTTATKQLPALPQAVTVSSFQTWVASRRLKKNEFKQF